VKFIPNITKIRIGRTVNGREWEFSHERLMRSIREQNGEENQLKNSNLPNLTEEHLNHKSKYAYIMLSYRVEDAIDK